MSNCRILTGHDEGLITDYLEILNARLTEIAPLHTPEQIARARERYTAEYLAECLRQNKGERQFVGHFSPDLDGILIESHDEIPLPDLTVKRAIINWVMAQQSGKGIGSCLIRDSIERARARNEDVVALSASLKNRKAIDLYKKLGFEPNVEYDEGTMLLMNYFINQGLRQ